MLGSICYFRGPPKTQSVIVRVFRDVTKTKIWGNNILKGDFLKVWTILEIGNILERMRTKRDCFFFKLRHFRIIPSTFSQRRNLLWSVGTKQQTIQTKQLKAIIRIWIKIEIKKYRIDNITQIERIWFISWRQDTIMKWKEKEKSLKVILEAVDNYVVEKILKSRKSKIQLFESWYFWRWGHILCQ